MSNVRHLSSFHLSFFALQSPRDMLAKSQREFDRIQQELDIDNVYNFFITAYHIQDYVTKSTSVSQSSLQSFLADQDIQDCRDLCDKGKHLSLTKRPDPETIVYDHCIGGNTPMGSFMFGGSDEWVLLAVDGREIEIVELAARVIAKWEEFLTAHNL